MSEREAKQNNKKNLSMQSGGGSLKRSTKLIKLLARLIKKKKKEDSVSKIRNERGELTTDIAKNINSIFHRTRANNPKISMEPQKTPNSQSNLEREEQNWWYSNPRFRDMLQRYAAK